jgi:hypothetical protein
VPSLGGMLLEHPQAAHEGPDGTGRPTAAREASSLYGERAAKDANGRWALFGALLALNRK